MKTKLSLLLCILFQFTNIFAQEDVSKSKVLRAHLPEMMVEREKVENLRVEYNQSNQKHWKASWSKELLSDISNKNYFQKSIIAEELSMFIRFKEEKDTDQFFIQYLEEVQEFLFHLKMDKKESFKELEEIFKMIQCYHLIQTQANANRNPLQKIADQFFYRTPYLERLDYLYVNANAEDKENFEDFYNDVQMFWRNAKNNSNNFARIIQEHLAAGTLDYNTVLMLVGKMYTTNQYYLATKLLRESIAKMEKKQETTTYHYNAFLLNLSSLYMLQGDYENMLEVQLKQQKLGFLTDNSTLIFTYNLLEQYEDALLSANQYLANTSEESPMFLSVLNVKVSVLLSLEKYDDALQTSKEVLELSKKLNQEVSAGTYFTLSTVYQRKNEGEKALKYALKAYETTLEGYKLFAEISDNDVSSLLYVRLLRFYYYTHYLRCLIEEDQLNKINFDTLLEEYDLFSYLIQNCMLNPSKLDKKHVIKMSEESGDILYLLAEKSSWKEAKKLAYNYTLLSKEIGLSSIIAIRKYAADSKNKDLKNLFEQWMKVRKEIIFQEDGVDIDSLKDISYGLHKELAIKTRKEVFTTLKAVDVDFQQVQQVLKPNQIAVEYINYSPNKYAALVLKSDMKTPVFIPLCNEEEIAQLLPPEDRQKEQWLIDYIYNRNSPQISALIIDPLRPYLTDVKTIYYSPAGILHGLSLEALISEGKEKRFGEEFRLKRVSKTSLITQKTKLSPRKASIFGGMNFDENALSPITSENGERGLELKGKKAENSAANSIPVQRVGGIFTYLSGTLKEANLIDNELSSENIEVQKFIGNQATEDQFKAYCKQPTDILHIASHAYFTPYIPKEKIAEGSYKGTANICTDPDPMNRAGIVFSGANYFWETGETYKDKENGILMASELSNYDLRATKLAIISACQSGIGQSTKSEGVFGFQRAIKLAGIENQIISLWIVDDAATQKFMTYFYRYYLELSDISEAVTKAKNELKKEYDHPYYWAAFVHIQ
ncbi:CHAT domain-containing protein [Flammeovirga pacifica]|uniref:CHAT domain-containing protein n=1 Tax=Flammeovirga pacifica TaxID=915059 RepID=A0A1S1YSV6_FLAPC|nr:CHAT domain-containing tetratricopeptide repeat protein [Flammeovirga pacifica]OHX63885.1 hypothetical protein NH26_19935 [Flammeovirga pacifica]